jgi:hypothetical protein
MCSTRAALSFWRAASLPIRCGGTRVVWVWVLGDSVACMLAVTRMLGWVRAKIRLK